MIPLGEDLPGTLLDLLVSVDAAVVAGQDITGAVFGGDPAEMVYAGYQALPPTLGAQFLEAFDEPWDMLLICHDTHSSLTKIVDWVTAQTDVVLLLATPAGPPAPAVAVFISPEHQAKAAG